MNSIKRFSDKVAYYDKFRPHYPDEMMEFFSKELNFSFSSVIADIGSGTGISSEIFLRNGNKVFAVEPNNEMRNAAEIKFKNFHNFNSLNGTAENTLLENSSVDFIVCAQSFHWFNKAQCRKEFFRILKPGGFVILTWNERKTSSSDFLKEYDDLLLRVSEDYENVNHTNMTNNNMEVFEEFFGKTNFRLKIFYNEQVFYKEGLFGRTLSCSYIPKENHPDYLIMVNGLNEIFEKYNTNGKVKFEYDTKVFYGKIK